MDTVWNDDRGIAMTEGVIVMPFFIILMMALIGLHHLHEGRIKAQTASKAKALMHAMSGCEGIPGSVTDSSELVSELDTEQQALLEAGAGESPMAGPAHTTGEETVVVDDMPRMMGGPTSLVKGAQYITCTMPAQDAIWGGISGALDGMIDRRLE